MKRPPITPGDWLLTPDREGIIAESSNVANVNGAHDPTEAFANARAIAALPALLSALESALEHFEGRVHYSPLQARKEGEIRAALTLAGYTV